MAKAPKDEFGTPLDTKRLDTKSTSVNTTTLAGIIKASGGQDAINLARDEQVAKDAAAAVNTANAARQAQIDAVKAATDKAAADKAASDKAAADKSAAAQAEAARIAAELAARSSGALDPNTAARIKQLEAQVLALSNANNATLTAQNAATLQAAKDKAMARQSAIDVITDRFTQYGLGSLASKIRDLAVDGANEATITLGLQATEEYKVRFAANDARVKSGLKVLNPAEYLNLEDGYRQVLRSYGLKAFDTDAYVQQFIANDTSPAELSSRVVTAVQRVQNADPAISRQLKDFYGIGSTDLVAYVLDPSQQLQKIERQVAAAEIGVAAGRQGLNVGVGVAEQLAAQGVSQAEAQKGYATIADILPTAEKLSGIYASTADSYGQNQAEQEVFNSLASAQRARQKLTALELAQFGGSSGTSKTSLKSSTSGLI